MTDIQLCDLNDQVTWNALLQGVPHNVYHTWEYAHAIYLSNGELPYLLRCVDGDNGLLVCYSYRKGHEGVKDVYSAYGFGGIELWGAQSSAVYRSFTDYLRGQGVVTMYFLSHPCSSVQHSDVAQPYRTCYLIDLTQSEDELWARLNSGHRYEIKKSLKLTGLEISSDYHLWVNDFIRLYYQTIDRVGASPVYRFSEETLLRLAQHPGSILLGALVDHKLEAAVLLLSEQGIAEYFINAATPSGKFLTRLLLWKGMIQLKMDGNQIFNLGGGATESDDLDTFKRRFGGHAAAVYLVKDILNQDEYASLCSAYCSADDLARGLFPPYYYNYSWKKNI